MKKFFIAILLLILFLGQNLHALWRVNYSSGLVYNLNSPLTIHQSGYNDINLCARYESKPLSPPIYWAMRIALWNQKNGWELEIIHQKLFLKNIPPEVQKFSITHGFNLLLLNYAWQYRKIIFHLGTGIVLAHPETTIRNKKHSENRGILKQGHYISGPIIHVGIEKQFCFYKQFFVSIEGKLTGSFARIPIVDGKADVINIAFHGLFQAQRNRSFARYCSW